MPKSVIIPITNVYAKGTYTAKVKIGSQTTRVNLILDTGSSALVVQGEDYDPAEDERLESTTYAQNVTYGMGGWFGPVVKTRVMMGKGVFSVDIGGVHVAVTRKEQQQSFARSDGIMGLAYHELNRAYDLTDYLVSHAIEPVKTYPWYLAQDEQDDTVREFKSFLRQYPKSYLTPYFCQLEEQGVVGDQFAFLILRSSIYQTAQQRSLEELEHHPLNRGFFVMGKPRTHGNLFKGHFKKVRVLDDKYYNVHVKSMRVGDAAPILAPELAPEDMNHRTNGIVDTGASAIVLPKVMFDQMISDLVSHHADFARILEPYTTFEGVEEGIDLSWLDLSQWPNIYFVLEGLDGEDVELKLEPGNYWQAHAPAPNQASFQFVFLEHWPNQSILGLPLMTDYYTVFDRQEREKGVIMFAEKPDYIDQWLGSHEWKPGGS
jgi:hypothetical protein